MKRADTIGPPLADPLSRRRFLSNTSIGLGSTALSYLLSGEARAAGSSQPPQPHFPPRAKRLVQVFAVGGMSHLDTFDHKPELDRRDGQSFDISTFFGQAGNLYKSPFPFHRRGESGLWVSDLLPNLAKCADKLTVIKSMVAKSANHMPAIAQMNSGFVLTGFPAMGAWVSYGLGSENQDLPAYVVLPDPRSLPWGGSLNWSSAFLPASHQGTAFRTSGEAVPDLATPEGVSASSRRAGLDWVSKINSKYQREHPGDTALEARLRSYEIAARMQLSVPEITDLRRESEATRQLYGVEDKQTEALAKNCLLARRLLEQGVRFVQIFHGGPSNDWGRTRESCGQSRRYGRRVRPAGGGATHRSRRPGNARRHRCDGRHRIRPHAGGAGRGQEGPRPPPGRLYLLVGRRRPQARFRLWVIR